MEVLPSQWLLSDLTLAGEVSILFANDSLDKSSMTVDSKKKMSALGSHIISRQRSFPSEPLPFAGDSAVMWCAMRQPEREKDSDLMAVKRREIPPRALIYI